YVICFVLAACDLVLGIGNAVWGFRLAELILQGHDRDRVTPRFCFWQPMNLIAIPWNLININIIVWIAADRIMAVVIPIYYMKLQRKYYITSITVTHGLPFAVLIGFYRLVSTSSYDKMN